MKIFSFKRYYSNFIKIFPSILIILAIYCVFRITVGSFFVTKVDEFINNNINLNTSHGIVLTEIKSSKLALGSDIKSTISTVSKNQILDGNIGIKTSDPRILAMKKFLLAYNSPMYPYADVFVNEAVKTGLDWRLVASISGVESAFGNLIPYQSNNGWGWRGGPGGAYSNFADWGVGIKTVTNGLAKGYGTSLTPFQIEPVYCPPCGSNPAHAWANGVTRFMNELEYDLENLEKI